MIGDNTDPALESHPAMSKGLIPRDYSKVPVGFYASAPPAQLSLIPRSEYVERIQDMEATKSRVSDIRRRGNGGKPIPALDQNGQGYCWAYSCTGVTMLARAIMNEPYVRLSGHMLGCLIKNYRDEGGWGALSLDFAMQNGIASVNTWTEKSMSRSNDTPAMRADALLHKPTFAWADLAAAEYNRNFSDDQAMTLLLSRVPLQGDFNWWGHSVCVMDPTIVTADKNLLATDFGSLDLNDPKDLAIYGSAFGKRILNSWTDDWGDLGEDVLTGSKAILNGGVAALVVTAG